MVCVPAIGVPCEKANTIDRQETESRVRAEQLVRAREQFRNMASANNLTKDDFAEIWATVDAMESGANFVDDQERSQFRLAQFSAEVSRKLAAQAPPLPPPPP